MVLAITCSGLEVTPAILLTTHWSELVTWLHSTSRGWGNSTACSKGRHPEIPGKRGKWPTRFLSAFNFLKNIENRIIEKVEWNKIGKRGNRKAFKSWWGSISVCGTMKILSEEGSLPQQTCLFSFLLTKCLPTGYPSCLLWVPFMDEEIGSERWLICSAHPIKWQSWGLGQGS